MAAILFRNVQVWDGSTDDRFAGEVLVVGNRIAKVAGATARSPRSRRERRSKDQG